MESQPADPHSNEEQRDARHHLVQHHEVVIVGAGFAGLTAAQRLGRAGVDVVLIDQNPYHQFQPLLYQVATSQIAVSTVARPLRAIFRKLRGHVTVRTAKISTIDAPNRTVMTTDGLAYSGQILVIAAGAEPSFFDTPGAKEHAFPLYSVDDATALSSAMLGALDRAATTRDATPSDTAPSETAFSVAVVGGGPNGVETAGAIAENINYVVAKYYSPQFAVTACQVHLVDMLDTVLSPFTDKSQHYAADRLRAMGVRLRLGTAVTSVDSHGITLADDSTISANVVIWVAGLQANSLLDTSGLSTGRGGRIDVESDLSVAEAPGVYVLGDAANIVDAKGRHLPQLAAVAQQSGKWAAANIEADLQGQPRRAFEYLDKGVLAMVGRGQAVAELGTHRRRVLGPLAFVAWLVVHVGLLSGVAQRLSAVVSWCRDYFTHSRPQVVVHQPGAYARARSGSPTTTEPD